MIFIELALELYRQTKIVDIELGKRTIRSRCGEVG